MGPRYWAILSGSGAIILTAIHFGPAAMEPRAAIIDKYEPRIVGWLAFAWLVVFIAVLVATCMYELYSWFRQRETRSVSPRGRE